MIVRHYYICKAQDISPTHFTESHWIDLADGRVLLSAKFGRDDSQRAWEDNPACLALPHILDNAPVPTEVHTALGELGVKPGHTTKHVAALARARHPLM